MTSEWRTEQRGASCTIQFESHYDTKLVSTCSDSECTTTLKRRETDEEEEEGNNSGRRGKWEERTRTKNMTDKLKWSNRKYKRNKKYKKSSGGG
jgi:hypothetical protein